MLLIWQCRATPDEPLNVCMQNLPAGPYIRKLTTLELKCNFFIEIPQRLRSCAVELQHLDLSYNLLLKPSDADIETVLRLPSLRHLWVTKVLPKLACRKTPKSACCGLRHLCRGW